MKTYCLKSSMIFLDDEKMIIDTDKKAIRKFNEPACQILAHLDDGPISADEIEARFCDENGKQLLSSDDIAEFITSLLRSGLLVSLERMD
ncbi:MAG: hypothetical protein QUS11_03295 [Candidatus Fermentibacter sp.]|nr:hypothetical protein [Candidatus Fermentibacter sp.]